jgi:TonB family protein
MKSAQKTALPDPPVSLFSSLKSTKQNRTRVFAIGYGLQAIVVSLLLVITFTCTAPVLVQKEYASISLVAPALSRASSVRQPTARVSLPQATNLSSALPAVAPPARIPAPRTPQVERPMDVPAPPAPKPALQPNLLAAIPAVPVTKPVHTGAFGEPVPQQTSTTNPAPAPAVLGRFGIPAVDMSRPAAHAVATGAFATQSEGSKPEIKALKSVDFTGPALAKARATVSKVSPIAPVAILSKPAPVYTEEARRLRVEGDVELQVVFAASGEVRIVRVVKGLGHGLDEAAIAATRQIRFTPARRDGQPVDYPATIHVVFALS